MRHTLLFNYPTRKFIAHCINKRLDEETVATLWEMNPLQQIPSTKVLPGMVDLLTHSEHIQDKYSDQFIFHNESWINYPMNIRVTAKR